MSLTPLEEALKLVLEQARPLGTERVFLHEAVTRVLAQDVYADEDKPPFDNAAMDGYALRSEDAVKPGARLRVTGEVPAGTRELPKVERGTAVKIFTGAPLPPGADAVVPVEFTRREGPFVVLERPVRPGENVRRRGEDAKKGELLLKKGTLLRGYEIGLLASVNAAVVTVYRRPTVGILSTGDEIIDLCQEKTEPSQIRSANNYMLYGLTLQAGGEPKNLGLVSDEPEALERALEQARRFDVFITTGGVSMGEKDLVKELVKKLGVKVLFHKLRIKPAKPVLFGVYDDGRLFFGLPGNPVSSAVAFDLLVYPAIRALQGEKRVKTALRAVLKKPFKRKKAERREFARCRLSYEDGKLYCEPLEKQESHMLTGLTQADAYLVVPEGVNELAPGQEVEVLLLAPQ
ncbi:MAG: molybdopterin molybdotransferase MoeA [Aquificae bacterium]|nr:molybdopterin molybdotransferase MoeA [Aquificota bacterium]